MARALRQHLVDGARQRILGAQRLPGTWAGPEGVELTMLAALETLGTPRFCWRTSS